MKSGRPLALMRRARAAALRTLCVFLLGATLLSGQTVRPVVVEYQGTARARFELVNDTLFPLNVVLEPRSFSISVTGQAEFRPLDSHIRLKLSTMSFRLPPRQSRFVFYEARADQLPAWFVIYSTFAGLPAQSGLNIQVELPHTVYLLQKAPLEKSHIVVHVARFELEARRVVVELENTGPALGRVLEAVVSSGREKATHPGFPLLPQSHRRLEIAWEPAEPPERLLLRFKNFTVEQALVERKE